MEAKEQVQKYYVYYFKVTPKTEKKSIKYRSGTAIVISPSLENAKLKLEKQLSKAKERDSRIKEITYRYMRFEHPDVLLMVMDKQEVTE